MSTTDQTFRVIPPLDMLVCVPEYRKWHWDRFTYTPKPPPAPGPHARWNALVKRTTEKFWA